MRVLRLALGDFHERSRRLGFLVMLVSGVWAAHFFLPPNGSHYATLEVAGHRALYGSGYVGVLVALLTTVFFGLAGFYLVKDAVERDRLTRVGEVLAATRLPTPAYLVAKALSNFLVLASLTAVLAVSAMVLQLVRGEDIALHPLALAAPFVWVTLPYMALVSAIAVLFEAIPLLRGGFGNVVWFALWITGIAIGGFAGERERSEFRDASGLGMVVPQIVAATRDAFPHERITGHEMSIGINLRETEWNVKTFAWPGVRWTPRMIATRLAWLAIAAAIALLATLPFDRFDAARQRVRLRHPAPTRGDDPVRAADVLSAGPAPAAATATAGLALAVPAGSPVATAGLALASVPAGSPVATPGPAIAPSMPRLDALPATRGFAFAVLVAAEVRLALRGVPRAWGVVALGLMVAGLFAPLAGVRAVVSPLVWIWPMLIWSALGTRDRRAGTADLLAASPHPVTRQVPAAWLAGATLAAVLGAPIGLRLLTAGDSAGALAWATGVLAVPAFALACGTLSGTPRLFEALYLALWYVGPTNRVAALDFGGASVPMGDFRPAVTFALVTAISLAISHAARAARL